MAPLIHKYCVVTVLYLTVADLQGSEFYKAQGGVNLLMIVHYQSSGFNRSCWLQMGTHTHPTNEVKGLYSKLRQCKARNLADPHPAAYLPVQRLTLAPLFPCSHQKEVPNLRSEISSHVSPLQLQEMHHEVHAQRLLAFLSSQVLPASFPLPHLDTDTPPWFPHWKSKLVCGIAHT
ncbi:hypothetical protein mRhiFer1_009581 [Rhinolophus ferrumequinum]|uniref:Uncharacterized protein n=1 Tax=Rhinolophus ferrumequinum TaxID=59479 RepID=A0A7J7ZQI8_RHIFE|nr:hypothetical protein mRhiFer1_009581 [Rhinolophus ferrumequinum]